MSFVTRGVFVLYRKTKKIVNSMIIVAQKMVLVIQIGEYMNISIYGCTYMDVHIWMYNLWISEYIYMQDYLFVFICLYGHVNRIICLPIYNCV
jgi:hypothetical protein